MPLGVAVTEGAGADCKEACALIDGLSAEALLADRGYDSNELIDKAVESGCQPVIPPRKNRKEQRDYDKALYRVRHLVEPNKCLFVSSYLFLMKAYSAFEKTRLITGRLY